MSSWEPPEKMFHRRALERKHHIQKWAGEGCQCYLEALWRLPLWEGLRAREAISVVGSFRAMRVLSIRCVEQRWTHFSEKDQKANIFVPCYFCYSYSTPPLWCESSHWWNTKERDGGGESGRLDSRPRVAEF